jgi:tRNA1Val (adenine37-N6)-methyltransferase
MPNNWFRFKKFIVHQDICAMKVGTDSVMLGAWCSVEKAKSILDIGAGTGIIRLMTAQRSLALIEAVEIDSDAFQQAKENIQESIYANRIHIIHADFIEFAKSCKQKYDFIVSNPPFFDNDLKPTDKKRGVARHSYSMNLQILIEESSRLLSENGKLSIVIPKDKSDKAIQIAGACGLGTVRSLSFRGHPKGPFKRILLEWAKGYEGNETISNLSIREDDKTFSTEYIALTRDFYLD